MKRLLITAFAFISLAAQAQQNLLLDQSFWQTSPDVNAIKAEIAKGANASQLNAMSFDPVVMAINAQAPAASIEFLLSQPGNTVSKPTHDGRIYLHWAANRGNAEIVEYLLKKGSKMDLQDSHGTTPLLFAASAGQQNTKIYDLFIAHGDDLKKEVNPDGANPLLLAIANDKDFVLTNYFVAKGLDLNSTDAAGNNAFSYAARAGNIELLKSLLQKGVKPSGNAVLMAAQGGRRGANTLDVFQYLETLNLNVKATAKNGENVLHSIVRRPKQNDVIQYFLSKGVDVNQADEEGNTVFMNAAAVNADTAVLAMLIPRVKNINQANQHGVTPLALAVRSNSPDVVRFLVSKGAAVNTVDKKGNNLVYYWIESYRPQSGQGQRPVNGLRAEDFDNKLKVLQEKGLQVTAPQKDGSTLYHLVVAKNDLSLLKRIEAFGVDVNSKNAEGLTALHKAAMISKDDTVMKYLLSIGAKKDIVTNFKETAYDLAGENESLTKNNVSVNFLK